MAKTENLTPPSLRTWSDSALTHCQWDGELGNCSEYQIKQSRSIHCGPAIPLPTRTRARTRTNIQSSSRSNSQNSVTNCEYSHDGTPQGRGEPAFPAKGQVVNTFGLVGHVVSVSHCNYSTLPVECDNSHRQYVNEWVWPGSNKTLFTKPGSQPTGCSLPAIQ